MLGQMLLAKNKYIFPIHKQNEHIEIKSESVAQIQHNVRIFYYICFINSIKESSKCLKLKPKYYITFACKK